MDWWLTGGSLKKQSSMAATESERASETQVSMSEFQGTKCNVPDTMSLLCSSIATSARSMISKKWEYCESYSCFGFISTGDVSAPDMQCILCKKVLSNGSMFPAEL
jgi:hypothetical protein